MTFSTWQQKQLFFGTFCAVFIMLLVRMDRQLDFQKNVTIKFLEIARLLLLPLVNSNNWPHVALRVKM